MKRSDTWMPLYWGDYVRDTGHLNNAAHGSYLMLIKHYWVTGKPLPDDDTQLWRIACCDSQAQWRKIKATVLAFFQLEDGQWHHHRVEREIELAHKRTEAKAKAGAEGARRRWQTDSGAMAEALICQSQNDAQSQSHSQLETSNDVSYATQEPKRAKRGTRLDPDWQPDERDRKSAVELLGTDDRVDWEAAKFRDYWLAKAGAGGTKLDWSGTWRNWCRSAAERLPDAVKIAEVRPKIDWSKVGEQ